MSSFKSRQQSRRSASPALTARPADISFGWSASKLRRAAFMLLGIAAVAVIAFVLLGPAGKWLCLACLTVVTALLHGIDRRAAVAAPVLSITQRGILDLRLMPRRIGWQEIAAIFPADVERGHVLDIALRQPAFALAGSRWAVRIGALCQTGYGVPAITLSMLLLDGSLSDLLAAITLHRPDLLHPTNRGHAADAWPFDLHSVES
jgi:hypothetical protein